MSTEIKKSKLYTRTGDQGKTRLVDGSCVEKFNKRVEAYGTVDELNSYLGLVRHSLATNKDFNSLDTEIEIIQNHLFRVGSLLACENDITLVQLPNINDHHIQFLESLIDKYDHPLPALTNFIIPFGNIHSCHLQYSRTLCRRAERRTAEIQSEQKPVLNSMIYLNRLSDLLFVCARWVNFKSQNAEVIWNKDV